MPAALSTQPIERVRPRLHVHVRAESGGPKLIDDDFDAVAVRYRRPGLLYATDSKDAVVELTPPAAFEFVKAQIEGRALACIDCRRCGYPHLDLGDFAHRPHRKHFCANCGSDTVWSGTEIVSTPLARLHDDFAGDMKTIIADRALNLDEYRACDYTVWASTPAIVWTGHRPQEAGIHVHVDDGSKRVVDDTFGTVTIGGRQLVREELLAAMLALTNMSPALATNAIA
jgi:hypothetical protein